MRWLKRLFVVWMVFIVAAAAALYFAVGHLEPRLKSLIEENATAALGAPVRVGAVKLHFSFPLGLSLQNIQLESRFGLHGRIANMDIQISPRLSGIFSSTESLGSARLKITGPDLVYDSSKILPGETPQPPPSDDPIAIPIPALNRDLAATVVIEEGNVRLESPDFPIELQTLSLEVQSGSLRSYQIQARLMTNVSAPKVLGAKPYRLSLDAPDIRLREAEIVAPEIHLNFAGLAARSGLNYNLSSAALKSHIIVHTDLAQQQLPPQFLPPGRWTGVLRGQATVERKTRTGPLTASLQIQSPNLKGEIDFNEQGLKAKGPVEIDLETQARFAYQAGRPFSLDLPLLKVRTEATALAIHKEDLFTKPAGVAASLKVSGSGNHLGFNFAPSQIRLHNLAATLSGQVRFQPKQISSMRLQMAKTSLAGWEKFILPLSSQPVTGQVELSAQASGDLQDFSSMTVRVSPLRLENIQAHLQWEAADKMTSLHGPVRASGLVDAEIVRMKLRKANVNLFTDLTRLAIQRYSIDPAKPKTTPAVLFRKPAGVKLSLDLQAVTTANGAQISKANLQVMNSRLSAGGSINDLENPTVKMNLKYSPIIFDDIFQLVPTTKGFLVGLVDGPLTGILNGDTQLSGRFYKAGGLEKSPLKTVNRLNLQVAGVKLVKKEEPPLPPGATPPGKKAEPAKPLFPPWPVIKDSQTSFNLGMKSFSFGTLEAQAIQLKGQLQGENLAASGSVGKVFDGSVIVKQFLTKLSTNQPDSRITLEARGLNAGKVAGFFKPEWKDMAHGQLSAQSTAFIPFPGKPDFLDQMTSKGSLQLKNGFLSTMSFDQLINETLAKVPGLGTGQPASTKGVSANISSEYFLKSKLLQLTGFHFITPERNEIQAQGIIGFDLSVDLTGTAYLATAPVGGSVREANSDASGRFVIPVRIKGNLLKPEASFAQESVKKILENTARHETEKLRKNVESKAKEEARKELNKGLEKLKEELKKKGIGF